MTVPSVTSCFPWLGVCSLSSMLTNWTHPALYPACASNLGSSLSAFGHARTRASILFARILGEYAKLPLLGWLRFLCPMDKWKKSLTPLYTVRISIFFVNCCNIFYGEYNSEIIEKIVTAPIPTPAIPTNIANIKNFLWLFI